jgi:chromosome segregation ATPase
MILYILLILVIIISAILRYKIEYFEDVSGDPGAINDQGDSGATNEPGATGYPGDPGATSVGKVTTTQVTYTDAVSATKGYNTLSDINTNLKNQKNSLLQQITDAESKITDIDNKTNTYELSPEYHQQQQYLNDQMNKSYNTYITTLKDCQGEEYTNQFGIKEITTGDNILNQQDQYTKTKEAYDNYKKEVEYPLSYAKKCQNDLQAVGTQKDNITKQIQQANQQRDSINAQINQIRQQINNL